MSDRRCYVTELERKVSRQKRRIKELEDVLAGREQVYQGMRSQYKNVQDVCEKYQGEINDLSSKIALLEADLLTMAEVKDEELQKVLDREHAIHNEAAAGMIDRIKELEEHLQRYSASNEELSEGHNGSLRRVAELEQAYQQLKGQYKNVQDLAASKGHHIDDLEDQQAGYSDAIDRLQKALDLAADNEQVRMKQLAERELVIIQKAERIKELEQKYSKLQQDLEYDKQLLAQYEAAAGDRPTSLERDIQRALNYWGADSGLDTADFILAKFLVRQLHTLKGMKRAEREHGIPPTRVATVSDKPTALDELTEKVLRSNARLASISIDDDGLGTIDVIE